MCSDGHQQYLTSNDMAMLGRVLAHPELLKPKDSPALKDGAAKYLIRKYQEGLTDEGGLVLALDRYVRVWRSRPQSSAKILPILAAASTGPAHVMPDFSSLNLQTRCPRSVAGGIMPIVITADLLRAADQIEQLSSVERSILLRRAAAVIQSFYIRLGSTEALAGPCGITFDLSAMASGIDLFGGTAISEMMREAVVVIGMLQEQQDVFSAPVGHG